MPFSASDRPNHAGPSLSGPSLAGLRVLDFTQVLSGPFGTQVLGDLGAEVIKVEPLTGDSTRAMPPHYVAGDSAYFLSINRNKRSIALDLKAPEGLALARRLALASDVVVENFRPGVLDRLGLGVEGLRAEKPDLIWCSISGFGQTGPYRDKPAFDLTVQALSGGMSLTGEEGGRPVRAGLPIADIVAGLYGVIGILAALERRRATGQGEVVDVSMLDCQAALLSYQAAYHLHSGQVPGPQGRGHASVVTYNTFTAGDGREFVVAALTDALWLKLCRAIERQDLADDPRFATGTLRLANREPLTALLEARFREAGADAWVERLERDGIPVAVVNTLDRVVSDPQILARGMVAELAAEDGRRTRVIGDPLRFASASKTTPRYPPALGEDSDAVLRDVLGLGPEEIAGLRETGVVKAR
ncbi:CaiB/BaiF CoA transferase family protein [Enterovirga rhinocerotis]|uniref:Crotonobetainyl-CoA:carnitine CoA-transferase CaiB-like acyl-CoA transferase n=1 Tax=Enterovirga rhinocerotis TaxID=1339210 RepID=A0A4R7BTS2_9HYPH|nr:CoA transferase [Enterovirga rhinocerotis]TDR89154.1 crotonobetainyl-CoA:carnitine CoA-transferase CaiB-like acyl-CoA transferase [Enterovirga rhinocerotis]